MELWLLEGFIACLRFRATNRKSPVFFHMTVWLSYRSLVLHHWAVMPHVLSDRLGHACAVTAVLSESDLP